MDSHELKQCLRKILMNLDTSTAAATTINPLGLLCTEILNYVSRIAIDEKCSIPFPLSFFEARWTACKEYLTSEAKRSNLSDRYSRNELRDAIKQKLRGITVTAEKAQVKYKWFQRPALVRHGTIVAIHKTPDGWIGCILCKDSVNVFNRQHFQNDLPLPLRCDDKISFLVQRNDLCTVVPCSIRVIEYCREFGSEAVGLAELFLETRSELLLRNKQVSALFAKLLSEETALQSEKFIEGAMKAAVDFVVLRFPIGSEEEKETAELFAPFGLNTSAYVDPMEQSRFLSSFQGSTYPKHLVEFCKKKVNAHEYAEVRDVVFKAIFLLFALLKEFPKEAERCCLVSSVKRVITEVLAPSSGNYELGLRLMSLIFSVMVSPPAVESWRNIPALLTVEEFHRRVHERMPLVAEVKATYKNMEEYFDTYFKLLREDAYRSLFRSVRRYLEMDEDKLNQKNDAIYQIRFVEVVPYRRGLFNLCRVEWKPITAAVKQEGGENSLYLHEGNLFCLSASGKFNCKKPGDVLFAVKVSEHSTEGRSKGILLKFLSADCNGISEVQAIEKLSRGTDEAVMVESPVFYRAYEPVLTALTAMDIQQFPFKSEVLNCKACPLDDEYMPTTGRAVDISPFQLVDMRSAKSKLCRVSDVHEELKANSILDETQLQAVNLVLSQRLAIIQGPPGTGKTFLTARIIQSLLNVQKQQTPILVLAYKNRVLDQLVSECTKFCGDKIIRLGRLSEDYYQDKTLQACLMYHKLPPRGTEASSMHCLLKSVAGMWKDWKETQPEKLTLSTCLRIFPKKVMELFFEFSGFNVKGQIQELHVEGPLRSKAEKVFEAKKKEWLCSQQRERVPQSTVENFGIVEFEAEDEHKERDRMCDTDDDTFISTCDDEEGEDILVEETPLEYLEVNDKFKIPLKEDAVGDSAQYLNSFFSSLVDKLQELHEQAKANLEAALSRIEEETQEAEGECLEAKLQVLKDARVIAMTTTKACIEHKLLHLLQPEMVVIEEAGGVLEPNVLACLTPKTRHLIMVGDYKQIGPKVVSQELRNKKDKNLKNFSASLMERLVDPNAVETGQEMRRLPFVLLGTQSRMNPAFLPLFMQDYAHVNGPTESMPLRTRREILPLVAHPQCMNYPLLWWSYPAKCGIENFENGKISNDLEVKMAATYCYWLYSEGFNPKQVAILSPYREQVRRIKDELSSYCYKLAKFAELSVFTVDEFQGHERDLVVLSLVRNNTNSHVGFLMDKTRQVVAVSRQKRALCIIGCYDHFKVHSLSWKERIVVSATYVSEHLLINGKKVKNPQDLMQLVAVRLKQHGRCQRPHYVEPLAEDRQSQTCQTEMKDHENTPVDSQMSVADELSIGNVIDGQIQTAAGNVEALPKQNEHSEVANVIEFEVPTHSVGLFIGKSGRQLKRIEKEAHLQRHSIRVSPEKRKGMQMVTVTGPHDKCEAAKSKIKEFVDLSKKPKPAHQSEVGHASVAQRIDKYLSFLTFCEDTDKIMFKEYKGMCPINCGWKNDDLYFLKACKMETCMPTLDPKDMPDRLRNYTWLRRSLNTAMEECLRGAPAYLKLEARFGKVLWRSDSQRTVSDEILQGRHTIKNLERDGNVSVEGVLGGLDKRWIFQTILSDHTILESVKTVEFPVIGGVLKLDITMQHHKCSVKGPVPEYLIRIKQSKTCTCTAFEVLEVIVKPDKPYIFDCLNLERDLDLRFAISCSSQNADSAAMTEIKKIAEELCLGMTLREDCLCMMEPPECTIQYARQAEQTMYLVPHNYILAHYKVKECMYQKAQKPRLTERSKEIKLQLQNEHHEVELWNCQWMADFAVLAGKTPEEAFALKCCDPAKIDAHPKDKSEVTAASVIRELDQFVACALELARIDRNM